MKKIYLLAAVGIITAGCTTTETTVHSYNGNTVEIELYGDTFVYGSEEQKKAQMASAQTKANEVCGRSAKFLSRRIDHQPQNGMYYVQPRNIALFQCR